jgi:hypothetical protein
MSCSAAKDFSDAPAARPAVAAGALLAGPSPFWFSPLSRCFSFARALPIDLLVDMSAACFSSFGISLETTTGFATAESLDCVLTITASDLIAFRELLGTGLQPDMPLLLGAVCPFSTLKSCDARAQSTPSELN